MTANENGSGAAFRHLLREVWGEPRDARCTAAEMAARRDERVRSIVRFAYERVPWYGGAMRARGLEPGDVRTAADLARLPIIEHEDLAAEPEAFLPRGADRAELLELKTSGSTLIPRTVWHDTAGLIAAWVVKVREKAVRERHLPPGRYRVASITLDGNPDRVRDRMRAIVPAAWGVLPETRPFPDFEDPAPLAAALRAWRPHLIMGYGSTIGRLFRHLAESGDEIPLPAAVTFGADGLPADDRRIVEETYGLPVFGIYGATEAFSIGFECGAGNGYHVNEDVNPVRIVDADGAPAAPGSPGSILLSNLVNRGTVLLNYRLGDVGATVEGPCPCGRSLPRIRLLEGRVMNWIGSAAGTPVHQYRLFLALEELGLGRWQIVETAPGRFVVRVPRGLADRAAGVESAVRARLRELLGTGIAVAFDYPAELERTRSGKVLSFIRRHGESDGQGFDGAPGPA